MDEGELRRWLAKQLRCADVDDGLWTWLQEERFVADAQDAEGRAFMLKQARGIRKIVRDAKRKPAATKRPQQRTTHAILTDYELARTQVLSDQVAQSVAVAPEVRHFRARVLHDSLLAPDGAAKLIKSLAARVFTVEQFARRGISPIEHQVMQAVEQHGGEAGDYWRQCAVRFMPPDPVRVLERRFEIALKLREHDRSGRDTADGIPPLAELPYPGPAGEEQRIAVWPDSVLDELREVGARLAYEYPWPMHEAIWFVLTGTAPTVPTVQHEVAPVSCGRGQYTAITLTVAPWISADTVQRAYRSLQQEVLGGDNRPVTLRSLTLFRFVRERRTRGHRMAAWRELLQLWNQAYPQWQYEDVRRFNRDYLRAEKVLAIPALPATARRTHRRHVANDVAKPADAGESSGH